MKKNNTQKPAKKPSQNKMASKNSKQNSKNKKKNLPIVTIITFSLSVMGIIGTIILLQMIPKKAIIIQKLRSQNLSMQMSDQDETLLLQVIDDTKQERKTLINSFPNEQSLLTFINIIDKLKADSVEMAHFSVDSDIPTKIGRNPSFLPMSLILKGNEEEVNKSLKKIVDSPFFIRPILLTKSIDLTSGKVMVSIQFHLYVSDEFTKTQNKS
jgi:hypothetical protein